ncbi:MAG: CHAT domain-containing protein [Alphaproteobacteria bacterium]|nr:CHAT domain-containing protein [Alphaproteobacteria bacterium]
MSTLELLLATAEGAPVFSQGVAEDAGPAAPTSGDDPLLLAAPTDDPNDLSKQRWGVVIPEGGEALLEAIAPLVKLREAQQGAQAVVYRAPAQLDDPAAWRDRAYLGDGRPLGERPRYLLLLGGADRLSLDLQRVLSGQAFVGRLGFDDPAACRTYAEKVARWTDEAPLAPGLRMHTVHDMSRGIQQMHDGLIQPTLKRFAAQKEALGLADLKVEGDRFAPDPAALLKAAAAGAGEVLVTASQGLGAPSAGWSGVAEQRLKQGALLFGARGPLAPDALGATPFHPGGAWLNLACFGAATPAETAYRPWLRQLAANGAYRGDVEAVDRSQPVDGRAFFSSTALSALANPDGPLAVIGHADLTWTFAILDETDGRTYRSDRFEPLLEGLVRGHRFGAAAGTVLDAWRDVSTRLTTDLQAEARARDLGEAFAGDPIRRARLWMLLHDLAGYVLLGDPAARLPVPVVGAAEPLPIPEVGRVEGPPGTPNPHRVRLTIGVEQSGALRVQVTGGSEDQQSQPHNVDEDDFIADDLLELRGVALEADADALGRRTLRDLKGLWESLLDGPPGDLLNEALGRAGEVPLLVQLAPDTRLQDFPWELLRDEDGFLGQSRRLRLARVVTGRGPAPSRVEADPVRMWVLAPAFQALGDDLADALREVEGLAVEVLTLRWAGLVERLSQGPAPHVLHVIGHGRLNGDQPQLALGPTNDPAAWVAAESLAQALPAATRLVYLECCEGGAIPRVDSARATMSGGERLAAVAGASIVHLAPVDANKAHPLARAFYRALFGGGEDAGDLARALVQARLVTAEHAAVTPALYLRGDATRLFSAPAPVLPSLAERLQAAFEREDTLLPDAAPDDAGIALFGREEGFAWFDGLWGEACGGAQRIGMVLGEVGAGKSALADAVALRALERPDAVVVVSAGADAVHRDDALRSVRDLLQQVSGGRSPRVRGAGVEARTLARLRARALALVEEMAEGEPQLLRALLPLGNPLRAALAQADPGWDAPPPALDEPTLIEQSIRLMRRLTQGGPMLWIVEDGHWVDGATLGVVARVAEALADAPLMVLGTARRSELEAMRAERGDRFQRLRRLGQQRSSAPVLDLGELPEAATQAVVVGLVDRACPPLGQDEGFAQALWAQTRGNPLFTREMLEDLRARGDVRPGPDGAWVASETLDWSTLPAVLSDVIGERLTHIDADLRDILEAASVEGDTFDAQGLHRLLSGAGSDEGAQRKLLRTLSGDLAQRFGVIRDSGVKRLPGIRLSLYSFTHPLFRAWFYDRLGDNERVIYHEELAAFLEEVYGSHLEDVALRLAWHYEGAGMYSRAAERLLMSAQRALRLSAMGDALAQLAKALALNDQVEDTETRETLALELLVARSIAEKALHGWASEEVMASYARAMDLSERLGPTPTLAPVVFGRWAAALVTLRLMEAARVAEECQALGEALEDDGILLQALIAKGNTDFWLGRLTGARDACDRALALFDPERHGDHVVEYGQDPRSIAWMFSILPANVQGDAAAADAGERDMLRAIRALDHDFSLAIVLQAAAWVHFDRDDREACRPLAQELAELAGSRGYPFYHGLGLLFSLWVDPESADRAAVDAAWARMQEGGGQLVHSVFARVRATLALERGDHEAVLVICDDGLAEVERTHARVYAGELHRLRAEALDKLGRAEEAAAAREAAAASCEEVGAALFSSRLP